MNHLSAEELESLLQHSRYTIENLDALKGVLVDAFTLYDITAGTRVNPGCPRVEGREE
jgi:hypothetical protein